LLRDFSASLMIDPQKTLMRASGKAVPCLRNFRGIYMTQHRLRQVGKIAPASAKVFIRFRRADELRARRC
jgi:hypothetical protein